MLGTNPCDVLDLGAGAGALTVVARAAGHRVVAADPSAAMVHELIAASPAAATVQCAAENLPFAAASFDVVTVATAFHWFDPDRSLPEIARVLRGGGRVSLTWSTRDESVSWARRLGVLLRSVQPASLADDWATGSIAHIEQSELFQPLEYAESALHSAPIVTVCWGWSPRAPMSWLWTPERASGSSLMSAPSLTRRSPAPARPHDRNRPTSRSPTGPNAGARLRPVRRGAGVVR